MLMEAAFLYHGLRNLYMFISVVNVPIRSNKSIGGPAIESAGTFNSGYGSYVSIYLRLRLQVYASIKLYQNIAYIISTFSERAGRQLFARG